jgi:RNA polymerase sigma-70 factor (ECF subfamily)
MNVSKDKNKCLMTVFQQTLDENVFEKLVVQITPSAMSVAQSILKKRALAEEAVQEAFYRVIRNYEKYDPSKTFASWFFMILRNICLDILRKDRRGKEVLKESAVLRQFHHSDKNDMDFRLIMDKLEEKYRSVLILRIAHSMSFSEIAAAMDISEEAAKKRAQRGLASLREQLQRSKHITSYAV